MRRRLFCVLGLIAVAVVTSWFHSSSVVAKEYPTREITLMLPYSPGGPVDLASRALADEASKILGQTVVGVNQAGGGGVLAPSLLKTKKPDGYNLAVTPFISFVAIPQMRKAPFDPLKDFEFIIHFMVIRGGVVCRSDSPWKSMKELVEYSKKQPGEVTFACPGAGGASHIGAESLTRKEGIKWRMVPYKGSIDAVAALMGGHVNLVVSDFAPWQELVKAGKLRILALEEEPRRAYFPDAQGFKELGYTVTVGGEFGILAPRGTPPKVLKTLHDAFKAAMETENFKNACKKVGVFPLYRSSKDLESHVKQQYGEIGKIVKDLGITGQ